MLFNSSVFFAFLALVLAAHYAWPRRHWTSEKVFLLIASYFFYAWWDVRFVSLLIISTLVDYVAVRKLHTETEHRKRWVILSLLVNLGILGTFKYFNFFLESANALLQSVGINPLGLHLHVVLPVGISFYTFQTISLTVDTYRGKIRRRPSLLDVAVYVAFFPQLVAGPIIRARSFLPQILTKPRFRPPLFMWGWWLIWLGLFKKVVIADNLAPFVAGAVGDPNLSLAHALVSWKAALCFALQIYGDFSGYSDIAIGIAALLGLHFQRNFRSPYIAVSFSDFWRRWHISLSTWLRDYLYISLGGNRQGRWLTRRNLLLTMVLGGLWHGASWNFVLWGAMHGVLLLGEPLLFRRRLHDRPASLLMDLGRTSMMFLLILLTWVPFICPDLPTTLDMYHSMFFNWSDSSFGVLMGNLPVIAIGLLMIGGNFLAVRGILPRRAPSWCRCAATVLMIHAIAHFRGGSSAFIYFQF